LLRLSPLSTTVAIRLATVIWDHSHLSDESRRHGRYYQLSNIFLLHFSDIVPSRNSSWSRRFETNFLQVQPFHVFRDSTFKTAIGFCC
jgi:hypothetical protein